MKRVFCEAVFSGPGSPAENRQKFRRIRPSLLRKNPIGEIGIIPIKSAEYTSFVINASTMAITISRMLTLVMFSRKLDLKMSLKVVAS